MDRIPARLWRLPDRLTPGRARLLIGLSATMFAFAGLGIWAYDGRRAVVYAVLFLSIGLTNLAWGVGSLIPDERRSRAARTATLPIGIVMFTAIFLYALFELSGSW
jgi:L-lactate permease